MKRSVVLLLLTLMACGKETPAPTPPPADQTPPVPPVATAGPSAVMTVFRPDEWQRRTAARFAEVEAIGGRLRPVRVPGRTGLWEDFHLEGRIADADVGGLLAVLHDDVADLLRTAKARLDGSFEPVGADFEPALASAVLRAPVPPQAGFTVRYELDERHGAVYVLAARLAEDHWNVAVAVHEDAGG